MSRHTPRHERWDKRGPGEYTRNGSAVRFVRGAWYAWVSYRLRPEDLTDPSAAGWEPHRDQVGPFKRPRNAMMAAEERMLLLRRRYGDRVAFDPAAG
jgi:hypothetical protein